MQARLSSGAYTVAKEEEEEKKFACWRRNFP
jgi:hypothetical protein